MRNGLMGCLSYVAERAGLQRCGKSCRLTWINYIRPGLKRGAFLLQEERQIIHLQSILCNRWSLIAAHLQGRTDNEIKNYWNSCIKKKINSKHVTHYTANGVTKNKSNITIQPHCICYQNSVFTHCPEAFTAANADEPFLDVIHEGDQPPNNTSNVVSTGENQCSLPGVLESIHEEGLDQNLKFSIETDPTSNHLFSCSYLGNDSTSTRCHDNGDGHNNHETAKHTNSWTAGTACTITANNLTERQLMEQKLENNIDCKILNENEIMIDYSLFTASSGISGWIASNSHSNIAVDFSHVLDQGASQIRAPSAPNWSNDFLFDDDYKLDLNLFDDDYNSLLAQTEQLGCRVCD